jgi:hypothetical protein
MIEVYYEEARHQLGLPKLDCLYGWLDHHRASSHKRIVTPSFSELSQRITLSNSALTAYIKQKPTPPEPQPNNIYSIVRPPTQKISPSTQ